MRVAIMQPYLFPYLGYFQLMHYAEKFIILDDVNFIKKGWINRNNILLNHKPHRFTMPLQKASQNFKINDLVIGTDEKWNWKFLETLRVAYQHAPFYGDVMELIRSIILHEDRQLSNFLFNSLKTLAEYLGIKAEFIPASMLGESRGLKGQERIIDLCIREKAREYVNLPGGKSLYDSLIFMQHNIQLVFIIPQLAPYPQQHKGEFVPSLSIIDVLMNNSRGYVQQMLSSYEVVSE